MENKRPLNLFTLVMINITAVLSLSSIAYMATIGLASIWFFALAAIMFFIPSALVCAELSSMMHSDNGGVFTWVSRAFGEKTGLVAIWMEWFNNVISYASTLSALVATLAYLGFSGLDTNPHTIFVAMNIILWSVIFFNFSPISKIATLNIVGALFGMILPGVLIISCGIYWMFHGHIQVQFGEFSSYEPVMGFATFALFVKVLSSYSGIQAVSFHSRNIQKPERNIPLSMIIAVIAIFSLTAIATICLASIIPSDKVNAMNGLIQGITIVLDKLNLHFLSGPISLCIAIGMLAALSTWVLGPARAMQEVARQGLIPHEFAAINKHGMPINVLFIEGIIGTFLSLAFLYMPSIQAAFAMIIALTSQFTVFMFIMIFASAIYLRYKEPHTHRIFRVGPKGSNIGMIVVATLGLISCGCGFFLGIFPPKFSHVQNVSSYITLMLIADVIIIAIPFTYIGFRAYVKNSMKD